MKFSILVPAYKPQFLAECIESILAQTYGDWELIIVNDASPYDIDSIVGRFSDSRIRYYKREKGFGAERLVDNWNECLSYATGEYVINMGDDDKLCPNCLHDYLKLIMKYPGKHIYHTRVEYINELSEVTKVQDERPEEESVYSMMLRKLNGCRICIGEFLFATRTLRDLGGYYNVPYAWGADDISSYEAAKIGGCANCNYPGFQYRDNSLTITSQNDIMPEKYEATIIWEKWYKEFVKTAPLDSNDIERREALSAFLPLTYVLRASYIDKDINNRLLKGWFYWTKRIHKNICIGVKQRTLFVFLAYALLSKMKIKWYNLNP